MTITSSRRVIGVRFNKIGKLYHFDFSAYPQIQVDDYVIVETIRGRQMGQVVAFAEPEADREVRPILRMATPRDLLLKQHWEAQEEEAAAHCRELANRYVNKHDNLKVIAAQYNYDGSLLTFLYTCDYKPNLTRLHNDLSRHYSAQVDLRQIGPRDVAKLLGGFGACGALRCCSTFLTDFSPVSIKMAKAQGISLNPSEITGMCGRLRCCLVYEYEQYVAARGQLPRKGKRIGTPMGEGRVLDVMPLSDSVLVLVRDGEEEVRRTFTREELVPLDELEALAKKAKAPCDKHGDGPCECGAKPGKAAEGQGQPASE